MTLHYFDWFQMKFDMPKIFTAIVGGGLELSTTKIQKFKFIYLRDYAVKIH